MAACLNLQHTAYGMNATGPHLQITLYPYWFGKPQTLSLISSAVLVFDVPCEVS